MGFRRFGFFLLACMMGCDSLIGADFDHSGQGSDGGADAANAQDNGADGSVTAGDDAGDGRDGSSTTKKDGGSSVSDGGAGTQGDGSITAEGACRPIVVPCLDPSPANVIEVPTESTLQDAITNAKAGDTIQINGLMLGSGWKIPAFTTLHGCGGATIAGTISAAGSGATFEGFDVPGSIVLNQTGVYVVRWNRFSGTTTDPGVSPRSIDALVSATVTATIEENEFVSRPNGIEVDTEYDTMTHTVNVTVQNNLFHGVASPIVWSRGGLVGKITGKILHNTFYDFSTAIGLYALMDTPDVAGNLFDKGTKAVDGDSPFNCSNDLLFMCAAGAAPPLGGAFAMGDPMLMDPTNGDLRLGSGSAALDRVPSGPDLPSRDFAGCPRPVGHGGTALGDIGAYEAP
jgi:hypothetical protein